ncbi:ABC transporter substrate-binding protein, partial [Acinetobacter baumannii]
VVLPFADDLKTLGIAATVRMVDPSQEKKREDDRDFDIIVDNTSQSISPGNEQRDFWGSASADAPGSRNNIGIKNPAIDKIVDHIVFAKDRTEL